MTKISNEYQTVLSQAASLLGDEVDPLANAANLTALIFNSVPKLNWVGFYFMREGELVLGPFQGQLACTRIPLDKGVCGAAVRSMQTQLVDDVHQFEGHIACDVASESELVVPFKVDNVTTELARYSYGVLDLDSPYKARFGLKEKLLFEAITSLYINSFVSNPY